MHYRMHMRLIQMVNQSSIHESRLLPPVQMSGLWSWAYYICKASSTHTSGRSPDQAIFPLGNPLKSSCYITLCCVPTSYVSWSPLKTVCRYILIQKPWPHRVHCHAQLSHTSMFCGSHSSIHRENWLRKFQLVIYSLTNLYPKPHYSWYGYELHLSWHKVLPTMMRITNYSNLTREQ